MILICKMSLKIMFSRLLLHHPGANELIYMQGAFLALKKYLLNLLNQFNIWQVSSQLSCGEYTVMSQYVTGKKNL